MDFSGRKNIGPERKPFIDLGKVLRKCFSVFFADDHNIFVTGKHPNTLTSIMNNVMVNVLEWLKLK